MIVVTLRNGLKQWMTPESAHSQGLIGCWHFMWLRFLKGLKRGLLLAHPRNRSSRD